MRIRGRLTAAFLLCGLVPMLAITLINVYTARQGSLTISQKADHDLKKATLERSAAVRDLKLAEVVDYFTFIKDQVVTMSQAPGTVDAMKQFSAASEEILEQSALADGEVKGMRNDLANFYQNQFAARYSKENDGRDASPLSRLNQLSDLEVVLQHNYIFSNPNPLGEKHKLDSTGQDTSYDRVHITHHPPLRTFLEQFGYYDIFLVDEDSGRIVYSVFKELDYATCLKSGPYAATNFGKAFQQALSLGDGEATLVDFECYYPSYEAPASFIASPIYDGDTRIGVLMFQMPVDRVNELMARKAGLGETGETLLVGRDGRLRSNSVRDPQNFNIVDGFRGKSDASLMTSSIQKAFTGETGVEVSTNYLGDEVVSAFAPLNLLGLDWAIVSEVTTQEAYQTIAELSVATASVQSSILWTGLISLVVAALVIGAVATWVTGSLVRPIDETVRTLQDIAEGEGDLTRRLDENQVGELGDLARNFNHFATRIHDIIRLIAGNATTLSSASVQLSQSARTLSAGAVQSKTQSATVSSAAEEMSINMENMSRSTTEMSEGISHVSHAVEEMKQTISEIAENAERSADVAGQAAKAAEISNQKVGAMGQAANEIGRVIEVIQDIAEQTNLLALNATIEAARAGEAGKGFAVVATEVKELAKQTAAATDDIRHRIESMQKSTGEAVDSIATISSVIARVNELSSMIASAVEEQSITTGQIAGHVNSTAQLARTVAQGVAESAAASREITENIGMVDGVLQETAAGADQSRSSGEELSRLAIEMQNLVSQFRVDSGRHATAV